jgi:DNA-binding NtrC family response regulator
MLDSAMAHRMQDHRQEPELQRSAIDCVFLTCFRSEFSLLATVLQYSGIRMHRAETLEEADFFLTVTSATAFLSDVNFLDGTWRDALDMAAEMHPLAAALIVADPVDGRFLEDASARGACGLLWKPLGFMEAIEWIRALDQAARDRAILLAEAGRVASPAPFEQTR